MAFSDVASVRAATRSGASGPDETRLHVPRLTAARLFADDRKYRLASIYGAVSLAVVGSALGMLHLSASYPMDPAEVVVYSVFAALPVVLALWRPLLALVPALFAALGAMVTTGYTRFATLLESEGRLAIIERGYNGLWHPWVPVAAVCFAVLLFLVALAHNTRTCALVAAVVAGLSGFGGLGHDGRRLTENLPDLALAGALFGAALLLGTLARRRLGAHPPMLPPRIAGTLRERQVRSPGEVLHSMLDELRRPSVTPLRLISGQRNRWLTVGPLLMAALLIGGVGGTDMGNAYQGTSGWMMWAAVLALTVSVPLAAWRPLPAAAVSLGVSTWLAGFAVQTFGASWPWHPAALIAVLITLFLAAVGHSRMMVLLIAAVMVGSQLFLIPLDHTNTFTMQSDNMALGIGLNLTALVLGSTLRWRREAGIQLTEHKKISFEQRARSGLLEERARIARELHDVVAHHMSVISVQADSAAYRIDGVPPAAQAEFTEIADSARHSMAEMRRLLSVLRDEEAVVERVPQPDLSMLPELVERARQGGIVVELTAEEALLTGLGLPESVALSGYRIVQEALSNVIRHAPGAPATVTVEHQDGMLWITVDNELPLLPAPIREDETGPGHGLVGMRERAVVLGGSLNAAPRADGGYRVTAVLPVAG